MTTTKHLSPMEIGAIRTFLPKNWRKKLAETGVSITDRQITEAFALRTRNEEHNKIVWTYVAEMLENKGEKKLAAKARARLSFCSNLSNIRQSM